MVLERLGDFKHGDTIGLPTACWLLGCVWWVFPIPGRSLTLTSDVMAVTTETCGLFCLLPGGPAVLPTDMAPPHPWLTLVFLRCGGDSLLTLVWSLTAPGRAFSGSHPASGWIRADTGDHLSDLPFFLRGLRRNISVFSVLFEG